MSKTKQTAVEILEEFLNTHCNPSVCDIDYSDFKTAINEAKQMEKEQMKASWNQTFKSNFQTFEQYYAQTYEN